MATNRARHELKTNHSDHQETPITREDSVCPIGWQLMRHPARTSDNKSYESKALFQWIKMGNKSSPLTREPLSSVRHDEEHERAIDEQFKDDNDSYEAYEFWL